MPYKKAGSIPSASSQASQAKKRFKYHLFAALLLMVYALAARFGAPELIGSSESASTFMYEFGGWIIAKVIWVWASFHLAMHLRLHPCWGFWGLGFLFGTAVIIWAGIQKPKWDLARARRPKKSPSIERDHDSLY